MTIKEELEKREKETGKTLFERQEENSIKTWCDSLEDGTAVIAIIMAIGMIGLTIALFIMM